jgi:RNA-binding protein
MKRAGEVVRTAQGLAVVRSPDGTTTDLGTELVDQDLDTVGRVVDVFGPVERPYLAVSPSEGVVLAALLGEKLYAR